MDKLKMEVPYFQAPNAIFEVVGLTEHEIITYLYLCRCGNQGAKAFPSIADIAYKTNTSEATAKRAVNGLIQKELITKQNTYKQSKNGKISRSSNVYEVHTNIDEYLKKYKAKENKSSIITGDTIIGLGHTDPRGRVTQTQGLGHTDPRGRVTQTQGVGSHRPNKKNYIKRTIKKELYINTEKNNTFEKLWNLYPLKRGKGSISETTKDNILKIGFEKMEQAISRYIKDTELRRKDFPELNYKNGSTFFNSGYKDYIEDDFIYYNPKKTKNHQEREYTDELSKLENNMEGF